MINLGPIEKILNGDGTDFSPPRNPLADKWERLYPSCATDIYRCMYCSKCPHGDYWEVPEEDKEVYDAYIQTVRQYNLEHGNEYLPRIIFKKEKLND